MKPVTESLQRHIFSVLVDDEPGVLTRVTGLFSGRGYNIDSVTVANVDAETGVSRITVVATGTTVILKQIEAQLRRLVPVRSVVDLTEHGRVLERETALVKSSSRGSERAEALRFVSDSHSRVLETTEEYVVVEVSAARESITEFIRKMAQFGKVQVVRSGVIAMDLAPLAT